MEIQTPKILRLIEVYGGREDPDIKLMKNLTVLQHDRGIVSMARGEHPDTAGSQFFIVHKDSNFLDGQYTAFGRIVPGTYSDRALDLIASLKTGEGNKPLDVAKATILESHNTLSLYFWLVFLVNQTEMNQFKKQLKAGGGTVEHYSKFIIRSSLI